MAIRLNSNINSITAQRYLSQSSQELSKNFQRLSSGLRINSASDDPAGLSVAADIHVNNRVSSQGVRNLNDGISLLSVAEGALTELSTIVQRQLELANQSANGTYSVVQRRALDSESDSLRLEFNRIVNATKFNGLGLYDGSMQNALRIQAGFGTSGGIGFRIGDELDYAVGQGTFGAQSTYFIGNFYGPRSMEQGDFNGDGYMDLVTASPNQNQVTITLGNGDGTFKAFVSYYVGSGNGNVTVGDFTGDGKLDLAITDDGGGGSGYVQIMSGTGTGTFNTAVSTQIANTPMEIRAQDFNQDGKMDLVTLNYASDTVTVLMSNGNGTFRQNTFKSALGPIDVAFADVNGDTKLDMLVTGYNGSVIELGNGDGTFRYSSIPAGGANPNSNAIDDFNFDGYEDLVISDYTSGATYIYIGNGNGTFKAGVSYQFLGGARNVNLGDFNGDGYTDLVQVYSTTGGKMMLSLGNGDGTFKAATSRSTIDDGYAMVIGDFNRDGVADIALGSDAGGGAGGNQFAIHLTNTVNDFELGRLSILTQNRAREALTVLQRIQDRVTGELGLVGAAMGRMNVAVDTLNGRKSNLEAAYSRIVDLDIAEETTNMVRNQILSDAATAIIAQANQQPEIVLQLLQ